MRLTGNLFCTVMLAAVSAGAQNGTNPVPIPPEFQWSQYFEVGFTPSEPTTIVLPPVTDTNSGRVLKILVDYKEPGAANLVEAWSDVMVFCDPLGCSDDIFVESGSQEYLYHAKGCQNVNVNEVYYFDIWASPTDLVHPGLSVSSVRFMYWYEYIALPPSVHRLSDTPAGCETPPRHPDTPPCQEDVRDALNSAFDACEMERDLRKGIREAELTVDEIEALINKTGQELDEYLQRLSDRLDRLFASLGHFNGGWYRDYGYYPINPDPGNKPIIVSPPTGTFSTPRWIQAPVISSAPTHRFTATCTATNGCDHFRWHLQRFDPGTFTWVTSDIGQFDGGTYTTEASSFNVSGFPGDGSLFRVKLWQSNENEEGWTIEHDDWRYFWNGVPYGPPSTANLISPVNGENANGNVVYFFAQNPRLEMMHPDFKYRIEVFKTNANGSLPLPNERVLNSNYWIVDTVVPHQRGEAAPVAYNESGFALPNDTAVYVWRALATFADDFSDALRVSTSPLQAFNTYGLPLSGDSLNAEFGMSVAMLGDIAAVGSPESTLISGQFGEVVIYKLGADGWQRSQVITIPPAEAAASRRFGAKVALRGSLLVVGASDPFNTSGTDPKACVFAYVQDGYGQYQFVQKLPVPADLIGNSGLGSNGIAVGLDNTIVAGAQEQDGHGVAYVFAQTGSSWTLQQKLVPKSCCGTSGTPEGQPGDAFGANLAIEGGTIVVGAPRRDETTGDSGVAYVFERTGSVWTMEQKLVPNPSQVNDFFGFPAINGNTLMIGAAKFPGGLNEGAAFEFREVNGIWQQVGSYIEAPDGYPNVQFGRSMGISSNTVVVGAEEDSSNPSALTSAGAAYLFTRSIVNPSIWNPVGQRIYDEIPVAGAKFGVSVAAFGANVAIGAPFDNDPSDGIPNDRRGSVTFRQIDLDAPVAIAVQPDTQLITNADRVKFTVIFNEPVQNVGPENFLIETTGAISYSTSPVITARVSRRVWEVDINSIQGNGTLTLFVTNDVPSSRAPRTLQRIEDLAGNPLGASVEGTITVDNALPAVQGFTIDRFQALPGEAVRISFRSSEESDSLPDVFVNGNDGAIVGMTSVDLGSNFAVDYVFEYVVRNTDPRGTAEIDVILEDDAGNISAFFNSGLTVVDPDPNAAPLRNGFASEDINQDRRLSLAEARALITGLTSGQFAGLDWNGDGYLSIEELLRRSSGTPGLAPVVYVNFAYTGAEFGTIQAPFNSILEAAAFVAPTGTLLIASGVASESPFIQKQVKLRSMGGLVRIGIP